MSSKTSFKIISYSIDAHLGRCPRCIRASLVAAAAAWTALGFTYYLASDLRLSLWILGFLGTVLTALWVTHVVVYAARSSARMLEHGRSSENPGIDRSRRAVLPTFAKAFVGIAVATAFPRVESANFCEKSCPDGSKTSMNCTDPKYPTCRCWCTPKAECGCYSR
jgi:hypothetical protein